MMEAPLAREESSSKVSAASFKSPRFADLPSPRKTHTSPDSSLRGRSQSAEEKALEKLKPERDRSTERKSHHHRTHSGGNGSRVDSGKDADGEGRKSRSGTSGSGHKERRGLEHSDGADRTERRAYYRQTSHGHLSQHVEKNERQREREKRTSTHDEGAASAATANLGSQQQQQQQQQQHRSAQRNSPGRTGERVETRSTTYVPVLFPVALLWLTLASLHYGTR
jgi:hypothetical protein